VAYSRVVHKVTTGLCRLTFIHIKLELPNLIARKKIILPQHLHVILTAEYELHDGLISFFRSHFLKDRKKNKISMDPPEM